MRIVRNKLNYFGNQLFPLFANITIISPIDTVGMVYNIPGDNGIYNLPGSRSIYEVPGSRMTYNLPKD
jgi:hypothetical protein